MYLFNRNVTEHRATNIAVFKHSTPTVQFMYSAADSTAGCSEGEVCNGTASSHWPYTYKSHTIQGTELFMTCLELSADIKKTEESGLSGSNYVWQSIGFGNWPNFYVFFTVHPNILIDFFTILLKKFFFLIHLLYSSTSFEHIDKDKFYLYSIWHRYFLWVPFWS